MLQTRAAGQNPMSYKKANRVRLNVCEKKLLEEEHELARATVKGDKRRVEIDRRIADTYTWVTKEAMTSNEHWMVEGRPGPYEHFPEYEYFAVLFDILERERIHWIEKSRDMMVSWACVAYLAKKAMTIPECGVLIQTQKEDKAIELVSYAKTLWRTQPNEIKEEYPLSKSLEKQANLSLEFAKGGYVCGIPGGADQIRLYHPWGYLNDESSFQPEAGECYNECLAAVKGKIIFNSSAAPGWYADARHDIIRNAED